MKSYGGWADCLKMRPLLSHNSRTRRKCGSRDVRSEFHLPRLTGSDFLPLLTPPCLPCSIAMVAERNRG